ncbi:MAG: hypothetical protein RMI94_09580 [Bryobacterales bacterium]|nr:hypothetical protein [Bryobacteraceae bacterium]MDW8130785.1 hypothetical protein [Bryobacterales bacterium]
MFLRGEPDSIRRIGWAAGLHLLLGLLALLLWSGTGEAAWIRGYLRYAGGAFVTAFALVEFVLALRAFRAFSRGDALRPAWLLISAAAAARLLGFTLSEVFSPGPGLQGPRFIAQPAPWLPLAPQHRIGLALAGPVALLLLSPALALVGRAYDRHGLSGELRPLDWLALGLASFLMVSDTWDGIRWSLAHEVPLDLYRGLGFLVEPLLLVLLFQALTLRRAALTMAGGLIGRCWSAYSAAVLLTVVGCLGQWSVNYGYVPRAVLVPVWYVWFLVSAAFAAGPAYQVEALRRAQRGLLPPAIS